MTIGNVPDSPIGRPVSDAQRAFFRTMPKVELHCHLLGAIRRETFVDLVRTRNAPIDAAEIDAFYERGERPVGVLRVLRALEKHLLLAPDDFRRIAYEYLVAASGEGVRHAEFFWNPIATIRDTGLAYADVQAAIVAGIDDARVDVGISALLIPSIDREAPPGDALAMVEAMLAMRDPRVPGIGIDYRENDRPPELFAAAYALARAGGLRATAHAGEFGMPWTNVATVIDVLGVDRVDHGYTIVDNPIWRRAAPIASCSRSSRPTATTCARLRPSAGRSIIRSGEWRRWGCGYTRTPMTQCSTTSPRVVRGS